MNTVYNASAGTGKTYQVTKYYIDQVIKNKTDPRDILLITFTDNAATELKTRIISSLNRDSLKQNNLNNDDIHRTQALIDSALITTIHGFCTTILKENAIEAGLSPAFNIISDEKQEELLNNIAHTQLINCLNNDVLFKEFCSGKNINTQSKFGNSVQQNAISIIKRSGSFGFNLENADKLLEPAIEPKEITAFHRIIESLNELHKLTPKQIEIKKQLEELLNRANTTDKLIELIESEDFKPTKHSKGPIILLVDLIKECKQRIEYIENRPLALAFTKYVIEVYKEYNEFKFRNDFLDFDDLQIRALDLINKKPECAIFKEIIVDEVQDTSHLQANIILKIWNKKNNLIICGDHKQSIYSWRGADPEVMPKLEKKICEDEGKIEHLQTSWRSKNAILEPINEIFNPIFTNYKNESLKNNELFKDADENYGIECLLPDSEKENKSINNKQKIVKEMEALAKRINLLVHGSSEWKPKFRYKDGFKKTNENNKYQYKDVLILLRTTKNLSILEEALNNQMVPYVIEGKGSGLFNTTPARDISLLLNALCDPKDTISLIGLLRSPIAGISDQTILEKLLPLKIKTTQEILNKFPEVSNLIAQSRLQMSTNLTSEIIRNWIKLSGYDVVLSNSTKSNKQNANLRKLIDWIREQERGPQNNTASIARLMKKYILNPPKIAEATITDPEQNSVRIMTVHTSKGLTKRVVCIPELSFRNKADSDFAQISLINKKPQLSISVNKLDRSTLKSPNFNQIRKKVKDVQQIESNNLFYVAMTRARDLVILSSSSDINSKSKSWDSHIDEFLNNSIMIRKFSSLNEINKSNEKIFSSPSPYSFYKAHLKTNNLKLKNDLKRCRTTSLVKDSTKNKIDNLKSETYNISPEMGTCGHLILEEASYQEWNVKQKRVIDLYRSYKLSEEQQKYLDLSLPKAIKCIKEETSSSDKLISEYPFLIKKDSLLIDGTIDLISLEENKINIYDYKFSEASDSEIKERYKKQLKIYQYAAKKIFPNFNTINSYILLISKNNTQIIKI